MEVVNMIIECCSQERSYQRFYGLLGERFCHINEMWVEKFDNAFQEQYSTVHRLETNKLRNVGKCFAQLFYTDVLPWTSLSCIHLNEEETNSSRYHVTCHVTNCIIIFIYCIFVLVVFLLK